MRWAPFSVTCAVLALGAVALLRPSDRAEPTSIDVAGRWPRPEPGVVFGPPDAPTGGEIVVGLFVPTPPPRRLVDLAPPGTWEAFLREEAARGDDPPPEVESLRPNEVGWSRVREDDQTRLDRAVRRRAALDEVAKAASSRTRVRVVVRDMVAADAARLALLLVGEPVAFASDRERLIAARATGTEVIRIDTTPSQFGESCRPLDPSDPGAAFALAGAIGDVIRSSALLPRLPADPLEILESHREADDVAVRLRERPTSASLRDLADTEVARVAIAPDGTLRVRCPDPGLDPRAHRIVVRTTARGVALARAWTVADLVGALDRRLVASNVAEAGAAYAPRVVFTNSKTGDPVEGATERLALVIGDRTVAEAHGTTDALGFLDARLAVREDAPTGTAVLVVGDDRFPIEVRTGVRVSVVTDRALYRPTDDVHARILVHRAASGRPVAGIEVVLRLGDAEKRVRTSAHGVASAAFHLVEERPGPRFVEATVAEASARAPLRVRAFETPTFTVACEPERLRLHAGEAAPVVVVARYVNGSPVVGAKVFAWSERDGPQPTPSDSVTDADGRVELVVQARADGDGHLVVARVDDADGHAVERSLEVEGDVRAPALFLESIDEPLLGREGRLEVRGEGPGPVVVTIPGHGPRRVELDADGRATIPWTPFATSVDTVVETSDGRRAYRRLTAAPVGPVDRLVVLPARRVATVGETLDVEILGPDGIAFAEFARDGTVLRARLVRVAQGRGRLSFALDADLGGVLTLRVGGDDTDTPRGSETSILVNRGRSLRVAARPSADAWRPGAAASVDVEVTDRAGRPTAAVLGYWGVDEALLALAPWEDGREDAFDAMPARADSEIGSVAATVERARPVRFASAREALGAVRRLDVLSSEMAVRHRTDRSRAQAVRKASDERFRASVASGRAAVIEALRATPLAELRATGSLLEMLRTLVRDGRLDPTRVVDAWGTPFAVGHGFARLEDDDPFRAAGAWKSYETGIPWRSAGPDLVMGTADDLDAAWSPVSAWELGGQEGRWLAYVLERVSPRALCGVDEGLALYAEEFEGPANNSLIGLGGGAGGSFKSRGGLRGYACGAGGARAEEAVHVRRDFSPTLCFVPEAIVGPDGKTRLEIPLKDSITTWRLRLVASAADGATGIGETRLRVSQPLHVEPWIATHLTVGDELDLPLAVRNETDDGFTAHARLSVSPELAAVGSPDASVSVAALGTGSIVFRLRAVAAGTARVRIDAGAGVLKDAIERVVTVHRDARAVVDTVHGTLGDAPTWLAALPLASIEGPHEHRATFYASPLADVLGSFEGLIACPHG